MAQETIDKIINIQFNYGELVQGWQKTTREIEINKKNLAELKQEYKNGEMSASEYNRALLEITSTTKALNAEKKAYEKEIQSNIKIETQASGSLNQLRASLQKMTAQYNALSAQAREGDMGKRMAADIKSQQEAINEAEMSLVNYRSQVGSYKDSILQALGINQQFTKSISLLKSPLGVAAGAVKACVVAFNLFKSSIHETQSTGDAFDYAMAGWRTTWDLFKKSVSTVDFSVFIRNAVEARESGVKLAQVLDELFERTNSINLQEGKWKKERAELEVTMRDVTKSYEERLEAGNKLLEGDKNIAVQRKEAAEDERDTQIGILFDLTKTRKYASEDEKAAAREEFAARIQNYNLTLDQIRAANAYKKATDDAAKSMRSMGYNKNVEDANKKAIAKSYDKLIESITKTGVAMEKAEKQAAEYVDFVTQYNLTNDKQVKAYVDAQQKVYEADAQVIIQNKRNLTTIKSLEKQRDDEAKKGAEEAAKVRAAAANKAAEEEKKARIKAAEDAHNALVALWDREQADEASRISGLQMAIAQKEEEYKNRLLKAQTQGGDTSAQEEMIRVAQEQVNILQDQLQDVEAFRSAYEAMGLSGIEIDNKRLEALKALQDAQKALQNAQSKAAEDETKAQERSTAMSIQSAQQLAGALGGLAEAAGADAGVVAMLAIAESAAAMGAALHKAFSRSVTVWDGIAGAVAAIATITTIVSQIKSLNSSADAERSKYRYASGGLVTGPGTGTSDSIPAMLSNGEAVMTAQAVNDWGAMLSAMNVASGGNAIQVSNLPQRNDGMRGMERMMERVLMNMPAPIVSVVDINKGQKRVKVQNSLGKLGRKKYA